MGKVIHEAIIITSWKEELIREMRGVAGYIFDPIRVTNIVFGITNSYYSFMIGPSGSKEGWMEDEESK